MPNLTSSICFSGSENFSNKESAKKYLTAEYPGIIYHEASDEFEYRGFRFDYFLAGISHDPLKPGSYLLIEKGSSQWLFSYGDKEERWKDFLDTVQTKNRINTYEKRKKSFCGSFLNLFYK